jgi:hypothetical protein
LFGSCFFLARAQPWLNGALDATKKMKRIAEPSFASAIPRNAKTDGGRKCAGYGDADYDAAQRACANYLHGEEGDLSAKLEEALRSGWSIEALKA